MYHERIKHINVRYHFIIDIMSDGVVSVNKIVIARNLANMLMKPISAASSSIAWT